MFVSFAYLLLNVTNFMLNLWNVIYVFRFSHKGYVCSNKFRISCDVAFFDNQCFFPTRVELLPNVSILPNFDELPLSLNYLNLELCILIVHRLYPFLRLTSSDIVPTISRIELKSNQLRVWHTLWVWDSTICLSLASSWSIRFSHTFLNATLSTTHIPICYYEVVKH